jgi:hypothetical protein
MTLNYPRAELTEVLFDALSQQNKGHEFSAMIGHIPSQH